MAREGSRFDGIKPRQGGQTSFFQWLPLQSRVRGVVSPTSLARHRRAPLIVALLGAFTLGAVALVAACSSQSEGARCQLDNDESNGTNEDCEDGLVCVASKDL